MASMKKSINANTSAKNLLPFFILPEHATLEHPISYSIHLSLILILLFLASCTTTTSTGNDGGIDSVDCDRSSWTIPCEQVVDGGPGQDGIPSIDQPQFSPVSEIAFLDDWELVLGVKVGDQIKAYPNVILYYHEIVNDFVGDLPLALTYCPLTGSGIGWERTVNGTVTTFGVSGLIHKNNLIPYDRETNSLWSQMRNQSIRGELRGDNPETLQLVEMDWKTWKASFPDSEVLNTNTGFSRNYEKYLYGADYPENNGRILFPVYNEDPRLENKVLVHGVTYGFLAKAYPIPEFDESIEVINDNFEGNKLVIAGSSGSKMVVSFERVLEDGTELQFEAVANSLPVIMEDQEGSRWNIFGEAVSGPREGEKLIEAPSYNAYWFAFADFFSFPQIHTFN